MINWFCVMTKAQQEHRGMIELTKQGFHTFSPLAKGGKPLFPRYIFVEFDPDADPWGAIRSTRGCVDVLRNGFRPSPIPPAVMDAVRAYEPPPDPIEKHAVYGVGEKVRITHGVLAGYEGLFQGTDKQRVQALLEILGKKVTVPIKDISSVA